MINFWKYLFLVSLAFSLQYVFFWLFYRKKTFHQANRMVLLAVLLTSLLIPLLKFPHHNLLPIPSTIPFDWKNSAFIPDLLNDAFIPSHQNGWNGFLILKILYFSGIMILTIRLLNQLIRLIIWRVQSTVKKSGAQVLVFSKNKITPFSFFYWIFLPEEEFVHIDKHPIIEHERTHARQWHSIDLLLAEFFSIFLWFVPFVYSFKNSMKSVHEYLADSHTIQFHSNRMDYLQLLASDTEKYTLTGLSNHFYCKTLKNRITMITKSKSSPLSKFQYLFIIPTVVLIAIACSNVEKTADLVSNPGKTTHDSSVMVNEPIPFSNPVEPSKSTITSGFGMRMHPVKKWEMMHNGIDFKAETGTPVVAAADGMVIKKEFQKDTYGNVVVIEHANGFVTLYAQLSEFKTELGKTVKQGEVIGLVGSSGLSTGPHLHFEIRKDGEFVNPADYLPKSLVP